MFIEAGVLGRLNQSDLWQGSVLQIGEVLRYWSDVLRILSRDCLAPLKILYGTQGDEAGRIVWRAGARTFLRVHIDFPADSGGLELLKDGSCC